MFKWKTLGASLRVPSPIQVLFGFSCILVKYRVPGSTKVTDQCLKLALLYTNSIVELSYFGHTGFKVNLRHLSIKFLW